jgi:hypothetical protein
MSGEGQAEARFKALSKLPKPKLSDEVYFYTDFAILFSHRKNELELTTISHVEALPAF